MRALAVGLNRRWPRAHFHPSPEVFLQLGGASRFEGPQQRWELPSGYVGLMPRGVPHAETPLDRTTTYEILVACHARDGFTLVRARAVEVGERYGRRITPFAIQFVRSERGRDAFRYVDEAERSWCASGRHGGAGELSVDLIRVFLRVLAEEVERSGPREPRFSPVVETARGIVRSHLADSRLSVSWLARAAGCSPDHLARRFRMETGQTVVGWIAAERVALAQRLLREEPGYRVAEVGWACGFSQPSYFIKVFRERTGVTPLAWRRGELAADGVGALPV